MGLNMGLSNGLTVGSMEIDGGLKQCRVDNLM